MDDKLLLNVRYGAVRYKSIPSSFTLWCYVYWEEIAGVPTRHLNNERAVSTFYYVSTKLLVVDVGGGGGGDDDDDHHHHHDDDYYYYYVESNEGYLIAKHIVVCSCGFELSLGNRMQSSK